MNPSKDKLEEIRNIIGCDVLTREVFEELMSVIFDMNERSNKGEGIIEHIDVLTEWAMRQHESYIDCTGQYMFEGDSVHNRRRLLNKIDYLNKAKATIK